MTGDSNHLDDIDASKFISYEPALGPLKIGACPERPDWIICGGESGPGARHMKPKWVRALRDECADLGIAFFLKQIGSNHPRWPANIRGKGDDMGEWPKDLRITAVSSRTWSLDWRSASPPPSMHHREVRRVAQRRPSLPAKHDTTTYGDCRKDEVTTALQSVTR